MSGPQQHSLRLAWGVWHAYCHVHDAWTRGFGWALVSLGRAALAVPIFYFFFLGVDRATPSYNRLVWRLWSKEYVRNMSGQCSMLTV